MKRTGKPTSFPGFSPTLPMEQETRRERELELEKLVAGKLAQQFTRYTKKIFIARIVHSILPMNV